MIEKGAHQTDELHATSPVVLASDGTTKRVPHTDELAKLPNIGEQFDTLNVFYDVFRSASGKHVFMLGPHPFNLEDDVHKMQVTALPSGKTVTPQVHVGDQALIVRAKVDPNDDRLAITFAGQDFTVKIQDNLSHLFANKRIVTTINKDNDLTWIRDWAHYYVAEHGADAFIVYDNGSTLYTQAQLRETLEAVAGAGNVLVLPWHYPFGVYGYVFNKGRQWFFAYFAQPVMLVHVFRKYAASSAALLNVDIDELALSPFGKSIFKSAERSLFGVIRFIRIELENIRADTSHIPRHADYWVRKKKGGIERGRKWVINPSRARWFGSWKTQPWTHRVYGWLNPHNTSTTFYGYHFLGVSTSWAFDRSKALKFDKKLHREDRLIKKALAKHFTARSDEPKA
jgi:hypothetical protein